MSKAPGEELLAADGIKELLVGEPKVLGGVSEENHPGCWSIE